MTKKTASDFSIKRKHFAGSLKPNKVAKRKTYDKVSGITPAGTSSLKFMKAEVPIKNSM